MKVLFLAPLPYVGSMPFAVESICALGKKGHSVNVLVSDRAVPPLVSPHPNVRISRFADRPVGTGWRYCAFLAASWRLFNEDSWDLIIGLSPFGLIAAAILARRAGTPYVYYNDEISLGDERGSFLGNCYGWGVKHLERWANRHALMTVTQDGVRGRFVARANRIKRNTLRYLPNSRSGPARIRTSHMLHDMLGLPRETKIVLWIGYVGPGSGALELARNAGGWSSEFHLVFHSRKTLSAEFSRELEETASAGNVSLSDGVLDYVEVDALVSSATIGLGLYPSKDVNTRYMGAASGKINHFLQFGIPCVVSNHEGLQWVRESGAGVCVDDSEQVWPAIDAIMRDYAGFQQGALRAFQLHLSFDEAFTGIVDEWGTRIGESGNHDARIRLIETNRDFSL